MAFRPSAPMGPVIFSYWRFGFCLSLFVIFHTASFSVEALAQDEAKSEDPEPKKLETSTLIGYDIDKSAPAHAKIQQAIEVFQKGKLPETRNLLDEARQEDSGLPPTDVSMAKLFAMARQDANARLMLERAVVQEPGDPEAYMLFGELGIQLRHIAEAQLFFEKAASKIRAYEQNNDRKEKLAFRLLLGYASVAERRGKWPEAIKYLKRWSKSEPEEAGGYLRLGRAYFYNGDPERAYEILKKASQLNPDFADASLVMAQLYQQQGKEDRADLFINEARKVSNASLRTRTGVGVWLATSDRPGLAKAYVDDSLRDYPESADLHLLAGVLARNQKDHDEARKQFEEAHRLAPESFGVANQVALLWATDPDEKKREKGIELAKENMRRHPGNPDAKIALGWIYYRLEHKERKEEVQSLVNAGLKASRISTDSSYFVAQISFDQGRSEQARQILERALKGKSLTAFRNEAEALMKQATSKASLDKIRKSIQPK